MMSVNKYTVNLSQFQKEGDDPITGSTIVLPLGTNFQLVDQDEIVQTKFVEAEIDKAINPILDYDKIKLNPAIITNQTIVRVENVTYNVHFLNSSNQFNPYSYFGDIGFDNFDIKFRKNVFTKTFLRLNFYDSDIPTNQRLISFVTLFARINQSNYSTGVSSPWGTITPVNNFKIEFIVSNNMVNRSLSGEGFFLYHFKDEITESLPKELFMRAEFNNAKNGKTIDMMSTSSTTTPIDDLIVTTQGTTSTNNVFTKYILKRVDNQYYYEIDTTYSSNVQVVSGDYVVDLYQTFVI